MAKDSQGSSHHLKVVGGAYGKRKGFIYEREPWKSRNTRVVPVDNYVIFYIPNKTILKDPEMPLDGAKGTKTE